MANAKFAHRDSLLVYEDFHIFKINLMAYSNLELFQSWVVGSSCPSETALP